MTERELYRAVYSHYQVNADEDEGKTLREYLEPNVQDYVWLTYEMDSFLESRSELLEEPDRTELQSILYAGCNEKEWTRIRRLNAQADRGVHLEGFDHFWQLSLEVLDEAIEKEVRV